MKRLLIVDDEPSIVDTIAEIFRLKGYAVETSAEAGTVLERIESFRPDLVFLDMDLKGDGRDRSGGDLLRAVRARWDQQALPVIIISGVGDARLLKELMQRGADDYEVKPIEFQSLLEKAERYINRKQRMWDPPSKEPWQDEIVGKSKVVMNLQMTVWRAAQAENDTLILGETGTGKDLVARVYHQCSRRRERPFYIIDCSNIPANLFEAEIFGYMPGAFTEARQVKKGRVEEANGGVVFFNEIGDLPLEQQVKLLTLLESKTSTRLGSNQPVTLDVVILAATNRDLYAMVEKGLFRRDLYYRLLNHVIVSPPLRDHREDIPLLVDHFIRWTNHETGKTVREAAPEVLEVFSRLPWPGNVRELKKCVQAGVRQCLDDRLTLRDVETFLGHTAPGGMVPEDASEDPPFAEFRERWERRREGEWRAYLQRQLERRGWKIAETARAIGIKREYLNQLIKRYGLERDMGG